MIRFPYGISDFRKIITGRPLPIELNQYQNGLSTRKAEKLTSVAHSEFSRIRNARFERFTLDRMITILGKLDDDAEVNVTFRSRHRDLQEGLHA